MRKKGRPGRGRKQNKREKEGDDLGQKTEGGKMIMSCGILIYAYEIMITVN